MKAHFLKMQINIHTCKLRIDKFITNQNEVVEIEKYFFH